MIYNEEEDYKIVFYKNLSTGRSPVKDYIRSLPNKERAKINKYITYLREHRGVLDEPLAKHIRGKLRELRVDFGKHRHRIFFFAFVGRNIILLHAFLKETAKTPEKEIRKAELNYEQIIKNYYEYEQKGI